MQTIGNGDERVLVARAARGDEDAFRRLVERHHGRIHRTAYAVVRDHADAAEVAQETWIKAWRSLASFRGEAGFATWLTRLALNAAADHLRRRAVRDAALAALKAPGPEGRRGVEVVDDRDELRRGLVRLPVEQRRLMGLRHALDLSVDEIAAVLGVPPGTVKSRLHVATVALRAAIRGADLDVGNGSGETGSSHLPGASPVRRPDLRPSGAGAGQPRRPPHAERTVNPAAAHGAAPRLGQRAGREPRETCRARSRPRVRRPAPAYAPAVRTSATRSNTVSPSPRRRPPGLPRGR